MDNLNIYDDDLFIIRLISQQHILIAEALELIEEETTQIIFAFHLICNNKIIRHKIYKSWNLYASASNKNNKLLICKMRLIYNIPIHKLLN